MSLSIFYKGRLKEPDEIQAFCDFVSEFANKHGWQTGHTDSGKSISIDIPNFEPVNFNFENGYVDAWAKYFGESNDQLEDIFMLLWSVKPFFKRLDVRDDEGWWDAYAAKQKKESFPPFRELKDIELAEYNRGFDLAKGSTALFSMSDELFPMADAPAVLMFMICKDMNPNLTHPLTKEDLLTNLDSRIIPFGPPVENWMDEWESTQFQAIVENWILKKLVTKDGLNYGEAYINTTKSVDNWKNFSWFMRETMFSAFGGSLGPKHSKLQRFIEKLMNEGYDFTDGKVFLQLIYSALEYLGIYRPGSLIERRK